ncbi:hypothetical protein B5F40_03690 [Gordonibacter sp. An230]|uniref:hypothetical protein n=1 Tax=Gordonibacter sp. An230 TaxID=1965592 RepID=UPI000B382266|nr:hypothetical protein [Gordonibacter sp. An230]OUO91544.1 hypothetical protein B5F40_03690 [Gordonibacter sp. An230]
MSGSDAEPAWGEGSARSVRARFRGEGLAARRRDGARLAIMTPGDCSCRLGGGLAVVRGEVRMRLVGTGLGRADSCRRLGGEGLRFRPTGAAAAFGAMPLGSRSRTSECRR